MNKTAENEEVANEGLGVEQVRLTEWEKVLSFFRTDQHVIYKERNELIPILPRER
jgi:hypothetical protein